ncbi:MAG TPA: hypothetical protein PK881_06650 [Leptospiraceae bacterium]|nr:hypothetical protein [Leptospiraceae bacterium]HMZ36939.1 hypothetical protein [Leptospiraceae bacterium]HNE24017.1 hypothetical protein [Leptospiraceae bacterium]HNJ33905.1 hypothetical protein [Leptospiraceae bacterium]
MAEYLAAAPVVLITDAEEGRCYFCGSDLGNASCLRSDGIWLWENGLDHYVLEHAIRLPDTFVAHIEEREFRPPAEVHDDFEFLPMPTGAEVQGLLHLE